MSNFDKKACLSRAKTILTQDTDLALRYACLELRFCIERIAYEKLSIYTKRLPQEVMKTWQPPQAFKLLLEYELSADQNFTIRLCEENADGKPTGQWHSLGTHKTFQLSWLRKTYNSLGHYLHAPAITEKNTQDSLAKLKKLISDTIQTLEPIVESRMDCSIASVVEFECMLCKRTITRNSESLSQNKSAKCLNPNCNAEYFAEEDEKNKEFSFVLKSSCFECLVCKNPIEIENRKLEIGFEFKCSKCQSKHQFYTKQWGYGVLGDENAPESAKPA